MENQYKGPEKDLADFNRHQKKKSPNQPGAAHVFVKLSAKTLEPRASF